MQSRDVGLRDDRRRPETVIEALRKVVGPEALMAMPAFPVDRALDRVPAREPDLRLPPHPVADGGDQRSASASSREPPQPAPDPLDSAQGPGAEELLAGHERAETPFGEGTPFTAPDRAQRAAGLLRNQHPPDDHVPRLRVHPPSRPSPTTSSCRERFPVPLHRRRRAPRSRPARSSTDPGSRLGRIDANPPLAEEVRRRLIAAGMACVTLGRSRCARDPPAGDDRRVRADARRRGDDLRSARCSSRGTA